MKIRKKGGRTIVFILFLVACLSLSFGSWAAPPEGKGPPEGEGPDGEKGRKPTNPGGTKKGDLMGDLWVVVRDVGEGDGAPIKFAWTWSEACYDEAGDFDANRVGCVPDDVTQSEGGCVQPISFEPVAGLTEQFTYDSYVDSYGATQTVNLIPLDPECKIPAGFEETWLTIEVESGRLNMARTTTYVLEAAYAEALTTINSALSVTLDPAGRLLLTLPDPTDPEGEATYEKVVDSPRENMALYQTLMLGMKDGGEGSLPGIDAAILTEELSHLVCSAADDAYVKDLQRAAAFVGGAADKFGAVGIDEVVYLNSFLGINDVVKNEADGSLVVEGYFDFDEIFTYDRSGVYGGVTADLLQPSSEGMTIYPTYFNVVTDLEIFEPIFGNEDWEGTEPPLNTYPVVNFVRAVDDAVATIFYIHNYELPECIECDPPNLLP